MAVVLVIDDPDISDALVPKPFDNLQLVLRFSKPAAVIVERHCATDFAGSLGNRSDALRFSRNARPLLLGIPRGFTTAGHPELWFEVMTLEHVQNEPGLIVHSWRKPPRQQPDTMPFQGVHLGIEAWDMLGAIIVGEELETQSLQHGRA